MLRGDALISREDREQALQHAYKAAYWDHISEVGSVEASNKETAEARRLLRLETT